MPAEAEKTEPITRASCWIDRELIRMAKGIGDKTDETGSEVIERHLRAGLKREYERFIRREMAELGGEGG